MFKGSLYLTLNGIFFLLGIYDQCLAQEKTLLDHPMYKKLEAIFQSAREKADKPSAKIACYGIECCTGISVHDQILHYEDLLKTMGSIIGAEGPATQDRFLRFGDGTKGYVPARVLYNSETLLQLNELFPQAISKYYNSNNQQMPWQKWVSNFKTLKYPSGDPRLALLSIDLTLGWTRKALSSTVTYANMEPLHKHYTVEPDSVSLYSVRPFPPDAFGLDLSSRSTSQSGDRGRAYKTIAGMLLAQALYEKGFNGDDCVWSVRQANLIYETVDLLYDHIGKTSENFKGIGDNTHPELSPEYNTFIIKVKEKINQNPEILSDMAGHVLNVPSLGGLAARATAPKLDDEFIMALHLLALRSGDPQKFEKYFGALLNATPEGKKIKEFFDSGANDIKTMVDGAKFVAEKLKDYPQPNAKIQGALSNKKISEWACYLDKIGDYFLPPVRLNAPQDSKASKDIANCPP